MVCLVNVLWVFTTVSVFVSGLPNGKELLDHENTTSVVCASGEVVSTDGKCVPAVKTNDPTQIVLDQVAKKDKKRVKSNKKRKLQKKLDKELKEIKKLVMEGLEKNVVNITDVPCSEGQEINNEGQCVDIEVHEIVNGTETTIEKKKKSQKLQKKVERELELALKKEIQNEMKRKMKKKRRHSKKTAPDQGSLNTNVTSINETSKINQPSDPRPYCDETEAPLTDCRPRG